MSGNDFANSGEPYGNYYFIIKVDQDDLINNEISESNNIVSFRIRYRKDAFSKTTKSEIIFDDKEDFLIPSNRFQLKNNLIETIKEQKITIYNIFGKIVVKETIIKSVFEKK